jgi:hypothetical protein
MTVKNLILVSRNEQEISCSKVDDFVIISFKNGQSVMLDRNQIYYLKLWLEEQLK